MTREEKGRVGLHRGIVEGMEKEGRIRRMKGGNVRMNENRKKENDKKDKVNKYKEIRIKEKRVREMKEERCKGRQNINANQLRPRI